MKKIAYLLLACMIFVLSACTNTNTIVKEYKTLVVYFSVTGNTKQVAEKIAEVTEADLYEIVPLEAYKDEDFEYDGNGGRASIEQNDVSSRPEIKEAIKNWDQYDTVFIGYPIWWDEEPRIIDTFVESYDFNGKTVITFCTSDNSGIGDTSKNLEALANAGTWVTGQRFLADVSTKELENWISEVKIVQNS